MGKLPMVEASNDMQTSAQELLRRGRRWLRLTFLPLLCLVLLLAAWQAWAQWRQVPAAPRGELLLALVPQVLPFGLIALGLLAVWTLTRTAWVQLVMSTFAQLRISAQREQRAEALKSAIVDHAQAALMVADENGRVVEFNPAAEALTGYSREHALGKTMVELLIPERFQERFAWGLRQMGDGDRAGLMGRRLPRAVRRADGSELPVEVVMWMTRVDGTVFFTASVADLTDVRAAAEIIERQRDALRQSEKLTAMGSLLAGVAHELNNPLAIVMGRASLLEEKTEGTPLQADATRIRDAAERCGRIVRTFLNMARSRPAQRGSVQLNDLVRAAADMLGYTLRSHAIDLELRLDETLPEVNADGDQIGQVVLNLLVNAQQALAAHAGLRRITITSGQAPGGVWLKLTDSGPGVPEAVRDKIFDPFFTTKGDGMGTGLGLSVSRGIVRDHGGELALVGAGQSGAGASFKLSLPLQVPAAPDVTLQADPGPASSQAVGRVLVVDDEPEIADLIRNMLEGAGYEVASADSGAVALEMLATASFQAIVSDLRMPDMDGAALQRAVREQHPALATRMLFVTGDTLSPGARQFLDETGCPRLDKPFSRTDLLSRLAQLLQVNQVPPAHA
ncbi:PAS domain S-box protein [Ramlibacter sp. WS9]|uniref:hybrid sensor histidine kinase/response regulator n=1 Tax=Ramlibacter sp. WS9 TaxID=1882741 RepID=UPI0011412F58|nr:PAS domain S-box protein [Ramlibacter sp. WS9]ROZ68980.1 PAS domain S-box protein [Ramlibacter sp. WS9]